MPRSTRIGEDEHIRETSLLYNTPGPSYKYLYKHSNFIQVELSLYQSSSKSAEYCSEYPELLGVV